MANVGDAALKTVSVTVLLGSFALMGPDTRFAIPNAEARPHKLIIATLKFQKTKAVCKAGVGCSWGLRWWRRSALICSCHNNQTHYNENHYYGNYSQQRYFALLIVDPTHGALLYVI